MPNIIGVESIVSKILILRNEKVMIDRELAELYGVSTKALNQAVTRNRKRFPPDFMFRLSKEEKDELVTNCDRFQLLKHSSVMPRVFTEQGVAMLSSVLRTDRAIEVNIAIMRAFVQFRKVSSTQRQLSQKLKEIEAQLKGHDDSIEVIFKAIQELIKPPEKPKRKIYPVK